MGKRRANNEGSIFFSESEQTWIAQVSLPDGSYRKKRNKKQAVVRIWLQEMREAVKNNTVTNPSQLTLEAYFEQYFENPPRKLKAKTISSYRWLSKKHIYPTLGTLKITTITTTHIDTLIAQKRKEGLSERSLEYIYALIRLVLNYAVKKNILLRNPANLADIPHPAKSHIQPLSVSDVQKLLTVVEHDRLKALWLVGIGTGLRLGELLALTWDCIDWDNEMLYVRQSLAEIRGQGLVLDTPKSEKSIRPVGLPDFALEALREQRKNAASEEIVFATSKGTHFSPRNVLRSFKGLLNEAGLPKTIRIHDLRHTFISHLLAENVPPKDVQEIAGHSSFSVTMDTYGHLLPGAQREAARKIGERFRKP